MYWGEPRCGIAKAGKNFISMNLMTLGMEVTMEVQYCI
jgi:hypothetical protein